MQPLNWEISVPLFKNRFILKDLGLAVGIPFGALILLIVILSGGDVFGTDAKYALLMIFLLFFFTWLLLMLVYRGRFLHGFVLDETGARFYAPQEQRRKSRSISTAVLVLSVLRGNLTLAGTAMIAKSRESLCIPWNKLRKMRFYNKQYAILLRGGFTEKMVLFCDGEIYETAAAIIREKAAAICKYPAQ